MTSLAGSLHAQIINYDISGGGDTYTPGIGVYGTSASVWNEVGRGASPTALSLVNDSGGSSSVTVTYVRNNSFGQSGVTGSFANLGVSHTASGTVTLNGLTPAALYDLVIYSSAGIGAGGITTTNPSFTVGGTTKTATAGTDWSTFTAGVNYVEFTGVTAAGNGSLSFAPTAVTNPWWSGFQLRPSSVPEPSTYGIIVGAGLVGFAAMRRIRR